jgi:hypothetical protein
MNKYLKVLWLLILLESTVAARLAQADATKDEVLEFETGEKTKATAPAAPIDLSQAPEPPPPEPTVAVPAPLEQAPAPVQSETVPQASPSESVNKSDARNEARFSRIFKKYDQSEISDDVWSKIAGDRTAESYTLQQGDTLWDVSTKFFGNGFYWPKVWQLNDTITNPHNIRTGNQLKFQPGSTTVAPTLAVNNTSETSEVEETELNVSDSITVEDDSGHETSEVELPPSSRKHARVSEIPPSFHSAFESDSHYDKNGFAIEENKPKSLPQLGTIPSIILEQTWDEAGKVVELEGNSTVASDYQNVILQSSVELHKGDFITVFSDNGSIDDPVTGSQIGVEVQTRGLVEITESVEGAPEHYRGFVTHTELPIRIGDMIKIGKNIFKTAFDVHGPASNISARLLNGEFGKRKILGLHNVVYLNKGSEDGLQAGNILNVLKNVLTRNEKSIIKFDPKPIGRLKIVHLDKHVATAIIVEEKDAIMPGDETGLVASANVNAAPVSESSPDSGDGGDSTPNKNTEELTQ